MAYDVEREPGRFAKARERSDLGIAAAFLALAVVALGLSVGLLVTGTAGVLTSAALAFVVLAAKELYGVRFESAERWGKGGNAERAVGRRLDALRAEGFVVMHDLEHVVAGNVDHFVSGPTGAFMVETKFRRYEDRDIPRAKCVANAMATEMGARWIQPVICVASRSYGPKLVKKVAVVGQEQLIPYLLSQANPTIPFERVASFADRQ